MSPENLSWKKMWLMAVLAISPYFFMVLPEPYYVPGSDECWQLQAAVEMQNGRGYRSSRDSELQLSNISDPEYQYMKSWPIGYTAFLLGLMKTGFSIDGAAKAFNFLFELVGLFGWCYLGSLLLRRTGARLVFAFIVALHSLVWGNYATSLSSWAVFPFLSLFLFRALGILPVRHVWVNTLGAAVMGGLLVLFRYQHLSIVVGVAAFAFIVLVFRRDWRWQSWAALAFELAVPTIVYLVIAQVNQRNSGSATFLGNPLHAPLYAAWLPEFFLAWIFGGSLRLDTLIRGLASIAHFPRQMAEFAGGVLAMGAYCLGAIYVWRRRVPAMSGFYMGLWHLCCGFGLLCVFGALLFRYGMGLHVWSRYYHYMAPAAALAVLAAFDGQGKTFSKLWIRLTCLVCFAVILGYSVHRRELVREFYRKADAAIARVNAIQGNQKGNPAILVVADHLIGAFVVREYLPVVVDATFLFSETARADRDTLVFLLSDKKPLSSQYRALERVGEAVKKYDFQGEENSDFDLRWKLFPRGSLKSAL